jgi:Type VI secretion system/phage-baseplate injector OB domain
MATDSPLYYGIYRGICVDNADPNGTNRIKLTVPQVLNTNVTNWAYPCTPVTDTANHLDHQAHTASQVAALLTTSPTTSSDPQGGSVTIPALTVVAKSGATTLKHPHITSTDPLDQDGSEEGLTAAEHTYHRSVPEINEGVWVMFEGGDPNFPVWIGVY